MLAAVTTYFNPCEYANLRRNYWTFRKHLKGAPLFTVEVSFDGEFEIPDALHLVAKDVLWHKEASLNVLINSLPPEYDNVAWIDADIIFHRRDWATATETALEQYPIVQLFEKIQDTRPDGSVFAAHPGTIAYHTDRINSKTAKPGYAWAARRSAIPDGLYSQHVTGGGDLMTLYAWYGDWHGFLLKRQQINPAWLRCFLAWGAPQYRLIKGEIGYLPGTITHLYHGSEKNRQYNERNKLLLAHAFDPAVDLKLGECGLWEWASDKPELHRLVESYFSTRLEDLGDI